MPFPSILYKFFIGPVELFFEIIFAWVYRHTLNPAISIVFLSLAMNLLVLPLYRRADSIQAEERAAALRLKPGIDHIKACFKGDERFMMLQTYYRQNNYRPYYSLRNSVSLLLQIPFFIAAYHYLSHLSVLNGAALGIIRDLGSPDSLIKIGAYEINALPVIMTLINIISGAIYTKGLSKTQKFQLYGMALIFLVLLYNSPAGLVFYWTLNNLFSLLKNIVYKLRNPKGFLRISCSAFGIAILSILILKQDVLSLRMILFGVILVICMQLPLASDFFNLRPNNSSITISKTESQIFIISSFFLCFFTGFLIPSAIIASSPAEFLEIETATSPLRYLFSSFILAAGTFLLWLRIFFGIATPLIKKVFVILTFSFSVIAIFDYTFFSSNYGMMSNLLRYDKELAISVASQITNCLICIIIMIISLFILRKRKKLVRNLILGTLISIIMMSGINVYAINRDIRHIKASAIQPENANFPTLRINKNGKNVIVIMADRAIGRFFPYLLSEKSELKKQFDGFTYYPNTFSYGGQTITGSPSLYGGYEYTPDEIQKRSDTLLKDKHNEALRVMPVNFAEKGYEVTVFDPSYAGYSLIPDLQIYDDYPNIRSFISNGKFNDKDNLRIEVARSRNFFLHSLFRISPPVLHKPLYDCGRYNELVSQNEMGTQTLLGLSKAEGNNDYFTDWYNVLKELPSITLIDESYINTFTLLANESTHFSTLLQKPMYEPKSLVDNTEYDIDPTITNVFDGSSVRMTTEDQVTYYHIIMATMLKLGQWFDYLRANDVYDNTRIIIVADHGYSLTDLFGTDFRQDGKDYYHALSFNPLLLVKDFNDSKLKVDNRLMSNADTPTLAFKDLILNPKNPATGNPIDNSAKFNSVHNLCITTKWNPADYSGYTFPDSDLIWFNFKGDNTFDMKAWSDGRAK